MPIRDPQHDGSSRTIPAQHRSFAKRGVAPGRFKFAAPIDRLEHRVMFSVSYDANGWTVVTPSANSKIIYVAPSGSDSNSGLSEAAPVQSFKRAESLLVSGQPDEILLESGQTYNDAFLNWVWSGQDAQDPLLVSYYNPNPGTPVVLPIIDTGTNPAGFGTPINQPLNNAPVNYVDIIGLDFQANLRNPSISNFNTSTAGGGTGFYFYNPGGNILLEDDTFQYYRYNMDIEALEGGAISNITIRRCDDLDAYGAGYAHSQGLYAYNISNLTVTQSVFDHDGWNASVATAEDLGFNHDIYIASTCSGIVIQQNILAEAGFAGIMARAGGDIDNNLFIDDAIAVAYGQAAGADSAVGGVTGTLSGNVMVGDKTYDDGQLYGQGFDIGNINPTGGLVVSNNIITDDTENAKPAIQLDAATSTYNPTQAVGINQVKIENNVTDSFREGIEIDSRFESGVSPTTANIYAYNNVTVKNNDFLNATTYEISHGNVWDPATESWSDDSYYDSVLSQSNWITVNNRTIPFSTWISTYDVGSKALTSLSVFPNPNVTIASYDSSIGGPGSWQDFIANADQMNISNYQPQYLALAGINYIQAGFGQPLTTSTGNTGATGASGPPTASAATLNLNDSVLSTTTSTYSFTVNYTDANSLSNASLDNNNLLVTGPNGYYQYASYESSGTPTVDSNGYQHVAATYLITVPNGAWAANEGGTYAITMLANQVYDGFGNSVPAGEIGSFVADFTAPTAVAAVSNINNSTQGASYSFTISYTDPATIDTTSLDSYSVKVTGPGNYSKYATVSNIITSGTTTTATYTVAATGSTFAAGTYSVVLTAGSVADLNGNTVAGGTLATFVSQANSNQGGGSGSITGTVFNDANGDGILDDRENTLTGVDVFIDLAGTGVYVSTDPEVVTNSSGVYTFSNLSAGQYTVLEVAPAGYTVTTPSTGANLVALTTGQAATGMNFANQLNTAVTSGSSASGSGGTSGTAITAGTGSATATSGLRSTGISTIAPGKPVSTTVVKPVAAPNTLISPTPISPTPISPTPTSPTPTSPTPASGKR